MERSLINGIASADAIEALRQLRKSGRRSIMVTGRLLADLRTVFPDLELLDAIVAENGAILYDTSSHEVRELASPPPPEFIEALRAKNVSPPGQILRAAAPLANNRKGELMVAPNASACHSKGLTT